jgi:hypothetical protein
MDAQDRISIHGQSWERSYIEHNIAACRGRHWQRQRWSVSAASHKRDARISPHDHCEICWWTLADSPDAEVNTGFTDGRDWICTECYERFIAGRAA